MILDSKGEFSDAQDLTNVATSATVNSTNVVDLGSATPGDIAHGEPVYLVITVPVAFTSAGAPTIQFALVSDSTADLATSPTTHFLSPAFLKADLAAGTILVYQLPQEPPAYERYLGVQITHAVAALTAGTINAFITKDPVRWTAHPDAI